MYLIFFGENGEKGCFALCGSGRAAQLRRWVKDSRTDRCCLEIMSKQELIEEYRERNIRWTDRTLSQLSFYNNLLLTLSIGFLSFAYKMERIEDINISFKNNIDWSLTLYVISITMTTFSILLGLVISLSRLYDFRLTRQVNQIRQRAWEHSDKKLDEKTPDKFSWRKRAKVIIQCLLEDYPKITMEQCKKLKDADDERLKKFNDNFRMLRNMSHNLGIATWSQTKLQTVIFAFAIISFIISELLK